MLTKRQPTIGSLLLSEPFMLDDHFKRSVILLTEQTEEGEIGYVLNYKSNMVLQDIMPDCWDAQFPVYFGGPVAIDTMNFIHRCPDKIVGGVEIKDGVYWGVDFENLKLLINNYALKEDEVRFFVGYSGWVSGQLQGELLRNTWMVNNKYNVDLLFDTSDNDIWKEVLINMGQKFAHVSNFPENPMWN